VSRSEVSRICAGLDEQVEAFRTRPLEGRYLYLFLDAKVEKVRDGGRVQRKCVVIAHGVHETGRREVIGLDVGVAETETPPGPTGSPRSDEVILQDAHRGVPARVVVLLAREHVVAVLGVVSLQRGRQQIVDLLVRQLEAPSLFGVELDRNRLVAAVQEHVPSVRMALHTLVV
jgi:Transposase, Mutator family